jgi:glycosyltransferase involved in cell wall biosynthesis
MTVEQAPSGSSNGDEGPSLKLEGQRRAPAADRRVTVVIPCFNQAHFLGEAVASVIAQTHPVAKLIVVDDGSTDATAEVARQFDQVSYVFQGNKGLAGARNAGLELVESEFVLFLDADDLLTPVAVETCLQTLVDNPEAAFVYGGFRYVDKDRAGLSEVRPPAQNGHYALLLKGNHIAMHGTVLYRTSILRASGGFDVSLLCCEDYDVYLRLAKTYPLASHLQIAAEYRLHGTNMTRNAVRQLRGARTVLARHKIDAAKSPGLREAYVAGERFWSDYYGEIVTQQIIDALYARRRLWTALKLMLSTLPHDRRLPGRLLRRALSRIRKTLRT